MSLERVSRVPPFAFRLFFFSSSCACVSVLTTDVVALSTGDRKNQRLSEPQLFELTITLYGFLFAQVSSFAFGAVIACVCVFVCECVVG